MDGHSGVGRFIAVVIAGVRGEGASGIVHLIGNLLDLFSNKVVSGHADTAVSVPIIERVSGASNAAPSNSHVSDLTETAVLEEVFMEAAVGRNERVAAFGGWVVDGLQGTLRASDINKVKALGAYAFLQVLVIDFVIDAGSEDAGSVDEGVAGGAAA